MVDIDKFIEENKKYVYKARKTKGSTIALEKAASPACLSLVKLINESLITQFIRHYQLVTEDVGSYWRNTLSNPFRQNIPGEIPVRHRIVFDFRRVIQPAKWYASLENNEQFPVIKYYINPQRTYKDLFIEKTIGKLLLENMIKKTQREKVIKTYSLNQRGISLAFKKTSDENSPYCSFIPKSAIIKLKEVINPDYWYIFPEELSQEDPNYYLVQKEDSPTQRNVPYSKNVNKLAY